MFSETTTQININLIACCNLVWTVALFIVFLYRVEVKYAIKDIFISIFHPRIESKFNIYFVQNKFTGCHPRCPNCINLSTVLMD